MMIGSKLKITWLGWEWKLWKAFRKGSRFNGGGFFNGANPYNYWRIGPLMIRKYR